MGFEPAVEKCIKTHQRKARLRKLVVLTPVIFVFVIGLVRVVPLITAPVRGGVSREPHLDFMPVLLLVLLMFLFTGWAAYFVMIKPLQRQYEAFSKPLDEFDHIALGRWQDGLDSASVGGGHQDT